MVTTELTSIEEDNILQEEKSKQNCINELKNSIQECQILDSTIAMGRGSSRGSNFIVKLNSSNRKNNKVKLNNPTYHKIDGESTIFFPVFKIKYKNIEKTVIYDTGYLSKQKALDKLCSIKSNKINVHLIDKDKVLFTDNYHKEISLRDKIIFACRDRIRKGEIENSKHGEFMVSTMLNIGLLFSIITLTMFHQFTEPGNAYHFVYALIYMFTVLFTFSIGGFLAKRKVKSKIHTGIICNEMSLEKLNIIDESNPIRKVVIADVESTDDKLILKARDIDTEWVFKKFKNGELCSEGKELLQNIPEDGKECVLQVTKEKEEKWESEDGLWWIKNNMN